MKKELVMMTLVSFVFASTFSLTVCAEPVEVMAEELVYDVQDNSYSQIHTIKEEKLQKANQNLKQFKSDLSNFRKSIKLIQSDLKKSKRDYSKINKDYKQAESYFQKADAGLAIIQDDIDTVGNVYRLIQEFFDPDMGYVQTEEDLQQAESDLAEVKEYLTQTRSYLKQFTKYKVVTSDTFKCDLDEAKEYVDFANKTKNSKKVKTKQKLDEEKIKVENNYSGYEEWIKYGIYDDDRINSQLKAFNKYRASKKLPKLKVNKKLSKAAAMLALEYTIGYNYDKEGNVVYGSDKNHTRPDGSSYTTAIKECGIKNFKSSSAICITSVGNTDFDFIDSVVNEYYESYYKSVVDSKKYTEFGIGYYSSADGSYQTWILIPISK